MNFFSLFDSFLCFVELRPHASLPRQRSKISTFTIRKTSTSRLNFFRIRRFNAWIKQRRGSVHTTENVGNAAETIQNVSNSAHQYLRYNQHREHVGLVELSGQLDLFGEFVGNKNRVYDWSFGDGRGLQSNPFSDN